MALGDTTILGPYTFDSVSMGAARIAIAALAVAATDKYSTITSANGLNWFMVHVERV